MCNDVIGFYGIHDVVCAGRRNEPKQENQNNDYDLKNRVSLRKRHSADFLLPLEKVASLFSTKRCLCTEKAAKK